MSTRTAKGPVTVSNTAELRTAIVAGYTADEIVMPTAEDSSAAIAAARAEGHAEGLAEGTNKGRAEGRIEGANAERQRIKDVEAAVLPGHEPLIAALKFDGKTTGNEAAAQVIVAERGKLGRRAEDLNADAAAATAKVVDPPAGTPPKKDRVDMSLPVEERCKAEWMHDAKLRGEFGNVEEYISFTKAKESGQAKFLKDRVAP